MTNVQLKDLDTALCYAISVGWKTAAEAKEILRVAIANTKEVGK